MKFNFKSFVAGVLVAATVTAVVPSIAKEAAEQITAVYRNIKLVVDGVLVEPKDANGNNVEPFIYNGTTYLPVRAVATAFGKEANRDGEKNIVSLGTVVDKPAKQLELWNRSYIDCDNIDRIKTFQEKGLGYLYCNQCDCGVEMSDGRFSESYSITYPLNALAKTVTGKYYLTNGTDSSEGILKIMNSNGKVLYQSPIMRDVTAPVEFEVNVENEISVTYVFECRKSGFYDDVHHHIENPVIVSSDY